MKLNIENQKRLDEIIGQLKCPKDYRCYKLGFKKLCKMKETAGSRLYECLEKGPNECTFSVSYGHAHFCSCPLRIFIANKMNI